VNDAPAGLVRDEPLAPRTTLGVGGAARFFLELRDVAEARAALAWAHGAGLAVVVLGGGSNLLVADRGLDALVLRVRFAGLEIASAGDHVHVTAGAGEPWDAFVASCVAAGHAGLECLSGIPGDVGATPIQNVGAYGQEVADTVLRVETLRRDTGELVLWDHAAAQFGYRDSVWKRAAKERFLVTRVTFALRPGGAPSVRYAELERALADVAEPSLAAVRAAVITLRRAKSMVLDASDENGRSAGSFFVNPTLSIDEADAVRVRAALREGEKMPAFPGENGRVKLSAGWLIERAGFPKGFADGRVGLSTRHALALVNRGGATATELLTFARRVRDGVRDRLGVRLVPEPVALGFDAAELGDLYDATR
jgi:UDP-N-acetylmuramate dehydrogenase